MLQMMDEAAEDLEAQGYCCYLSARMYLAWVSLSAACVVVCLSRNKQCFLSSWISPVLTSYSSLLHVHS